MKTVQNFLKVIQFQKVYTPTRKYPTDRDVLRHISAVFSDFLKK